jgi:hypothetical protein
MKDAFPKATGLHKSAEFVGVSTVDQIREAGFDVIPDEEVFKSRSYRSSGRSFRVQRWEPKKALTSNARSARTYRMTIGRLFDFLRRPIADVVDVTREGDVWSAKCTLVQLAEFQRLFHSYEEAVNGQLLSLVDSLEQQIAALEPRLVETTGMTLPIRDLQIFPSAGTGSWRVEHPAQRKPIGGG